MSKNRHSSSTRMSRLLRLSGLALCGSLASCNFSAQDSTQRDYTLAERSADTLADTLSPAQAEAVGGQIAGALEMLVGTPGDPQYLILEDWWDDEFDPNRGGLDELDDEGFDEVKEDNLTRFDRQLDLIAAGRYGDVPEPLYAMDLWRTGRRTTCPACSRTPRLRSTPRTIRTARATKRPSTSSPATTRRCANRRRVPRAVPALPRQRGRRQRTDFGLPEPAPARLPPGYLQVGRRRAQRAPAPRGPRQDPE